MSCIKEIWIIESQEPIYRGNYLCCLERVLKEGHQEESNIKEASGRPVINVENSPFLAMYSALGGSQQPGPMWCKVWKIVISTEKCKITLLIYTIIKKQIPDSLKSSL